jgi:hypothetical protein
MALALGELWQFIILRPPEEIGPGFIGGLIAITSTANLALVSVLGFIGACFLFRLFNYQPSAVFPRASDWEHVNWYISLSVSTLSALCE